MKITRRKWFWVWQYEAEEAWLNAMSRKGLRLTRVGLGKYTFEEDNQGYVYQLDFFSDQAAKKDACLAYIRFVEETGAEYVCSYVNWLYFRKRADEGDFKLYSDNTSKIHFYTRINHVLLTMCGLNGMMMLSNILQLVKHRENLQTLYLTTISVHTLLITLMLIGFSRLYKKVKALKKEQAYRE